MIVTSRFQAIYLIETKETHKTILQNRINRFKNILKIIMMGLKPMMKTHRYSNQLDMQKRSLKRYSRSEWEQK